jgi:Ca2+-binding EF-hand superfamily protein
MGVLCGKHKNIKIEECEIDEEKSGTLMIVRSNSNNLIYKRRDKLIISSKIEEIVKNFYLSKEQIEALWKFFKILDHTKSGYITLHELYTLICERPSKSIVGPFLDKFFVTIEKEFKEKITFEEFIPYLIAYNIKTSMQLKKFVFNILDKDQNEFITRSEIIKLFSSKRNDNEIFFSNFAESVRNYPHLDRSDKITFQQFTEMCKDLHFLYYPALKLQTLLRIYYIGENFWNKLHNDILNSHKQNNFIIQNREINKHHRKYTKVEFFKKNTKHDDDKIYYKKIRMNTLQRNLSDTDFFNGKKSNEEELCRSYDNIIY